MAEGISNAFIEKKHRLLSLWWFQYTPRYSSCSDILFQISEVQCAAVKLQEGKTAPSDNVTLKSSAAVGQFVTTAQMIHVLSLYQCQAGWTITLPRCLQIPPVASPTPQNGRDRNQLRNPLTAAGLLHTQISLYDLSETWLGLSAFPSPLCSSSAITDMYLNSLGLWLKVSTNS